MGNLRYFKNYNQITIFGCCSCKNVRLYCIIEENVAALFSLMLSKVWPSPSLHEKNVRKLRKQGCFYTSKSTAMQYYCHAILKKLSLPAGSQGSLWSTISNARGTNRFSLILDSFLISLKTIWGKFEHSKTLDIILALNPTPSCQPSVRKRLMEPKHECKA